MKTFKGFLFEDNDQIGFGFIDPSRRPPATRSIFSKPKTMDELINALPSVLNIYKRYGLYPDSPHFQVPGEGAYLRTPSAPQNVGEFPETSFTYRTITNPTIDDMYPQKVVTPGENPTSYPTTPKVPLKPKQSPMNEPVTSKFPEFGSKIEKFVQDANTQQYSKTHKTPETKSLPLNPKSDIYGNVYDYKGKTIKGEIPKFSPSAEAPKVASREQAKALIGRMTAAAAPAETVAAETASAAATGLGLGAEVAMGMAMLPAALVAYETPAGESYEQTLSPSERKEQEERKKESNIDYVKSLIGTQYNPQGKTPRERTGSR